MTENDLAKLCGHVTLDNLHPDVQKVLIPRIESLPSYPVIKRGDKSVAATVKQRNTSHDLEKRLLGRFLALTWQMIGSCVGHGAFNVIWRRMLKEVGVDGDREAWFMPYLPYMYACSRMHGTKEYGFRWGGIKWEDRVSGSTGLIMAEACQKYGVIPNRDSLLQPKLVKDDASGGEKWQWPGTADAQWALPPFVPDNFIQEGSKHVFKHVYRVRTIDEALTALDNSDWLTLAYNYDLHPSEVRHGKMFGKRGGVYGGHQVCVTGYDLDSADPGMIIPNSWPFGWCNKQPDGPIGSLWATMDYMERVITDPNSEVYAFSNFDGPPEEVSGDVSVM